MAVAQPTWLEDMAKRVSELQRDEAGNILTESYLNVCEGNLAIFTIIFNGYVTAEVGRQIAAANKNGQAVVRRDAEKVGAAGKTLAGLVKAQVAEFGAEKLGTPGEGSGTKSVLWLNRELTFICTLLKLLASGKEASEAGYEAYETSLKPYHTWLLQKLVGNAVGYVPTIDQLLPVLNIKDREAGKVQCEAFTSVMEPLTAEVLKLLEAEGAHFQGPP